MDRHSKEQLLSCYYSETDGWMDDGQRSITIAHLEPSAQLS